MDFSFRSPDADATRRAARLLGERLPAEGQMLSLVGPLGAGKTVFVKGLGEGLGLDPGQIASPTFVIAGEYPAARTGAPDLVHADLYRVESVAELESSGWLDWLEPGIALAVEWADRFPDELPADRLEIHIERGGGDAESERQLSVRALGPSSAALARAWHGALEGSGLA